MNWKLAVGASAVLLLMGGCQYPARLFLAPDSPRHQPAFFASYRGERLAKVEEFAVMPCRPRELQRPLWRIHFAGGPVDSLQPLRITYGQLPQGYAETRTPEPLVPGRCYTAITAGPSAGMLEFTLGSTGQAVEGGYGWSGHTRAVRQVNRAAYRCVQGYRAASSKQDSTTVDALSHPVADTTVDCGWLRERHPDALVHARSDLRIYATVVGGVAAAGVAVFLGDAIKQRLP
jgi:hypothetical protein